MSELIPVGAFELVIYKLYGENKDGESPNYAVEVQIPDEFKNNVESWIEAAACLTSFVGRHSRLGYEKSLEVVIERAMKYRDKPNTPQLPGPKDCPN